MNKISKDKRELLGKLSELLNTFDPDLVCEHVGCSGPACNECPFGSKDSYVGTIQALEEAINE